MLMRFSHGPETIKLGDLEVRRLGFGAMRLPGKEVWGEPKDPATAHAVAERRMELLAEELRRGGGDPLRDAIWQLDYMREAVLGQVEAACHHAEHSEEVDKPLDICQAIQDAIDVLDLAIERSGDGR